MPEETQGQDLTDHPEVIDMGVFEQILEMDDDPDDREFSKEIVLGFFEQAENTLDEMKRELDAEKLDRLSALGHFLKGSSATLGLVKMQKSCEKVQNYGHRKDATGDKTEPDDSKSLRNISNELKTVRASYEEARAILVNFFGLH